MTSLAGSDTIDPPGREVDRQPPAPLQQLAIGLEPARPARTRQEAVGDDDVSAGAGGGQGPLLDPVAAPSHEDRPFAPLAPDNHRAKGARAARTGPLGQRHRLGRHSCQFEQVVAGIARPAVPQGEQAARAVGVSERDPHLPPVSRHQQVRHRGQHGQQACQHHRHQSPQTRPPAPQRQPQAPARKQRNHGPADLRHQLDRAGLAGREMRDGEQQIERLAHRPPERRTRSGQIEQQPAGNQRHRHEGHQRDRHDIGERAIEPRAVEVEQHHRHQRQLDHDTSHEQHHHAPPDPRPPRLIARGKEATDRRTVRQGDDRQHRRKAHLETRPDRALGPQQEHQPRRHRHHPERQRIAPEHQCEQHQHRRDTAAHGRHLGSGEQGVGYPRQRPACRRRHRQPHPQGQPRPQRQHPQHREIGRRNHRADMQPADRKQVRQPGITHRRFVGCADPAAIPAGKGRRDGTCRSRNTRPHMVSQRPLEPRDRPAIGRRAHQFDRPDRAAGRRKAPEPRGAGEVVGAGQHRARRRHQPGAQPHHCPLGQSLPRSSARQRFQRHIDPHLARLGRLPFLICKPHRQRQADPILGRLVLAFEHAALHQCDLRRGNCRCPDDLRACPDHCDAGGEHQPPGDQREAQVHARIGPRRVRRPESRCSQRRRTARPHGRYPVPRQRKREPRKDPAHEQHCQPRRTVEPGGGEKPLRPVGDPSAKAPADAGQSPAALPRPRRHDGSGRRAAGIVSHRNDRHIAHRIAPRPARHRKSQRQAAQSEQELTVHGKRKQQRERRPSGRSGDAVRALAHRLPAYRRRAHRLVQLALRPPPRRPHPPADRGYRPQAQHAGSDRCDHRRARLARA